MVTIVAATAVDCPSPMWGAEGAVTARLAAVRRLFHRQQVLEPVLPQPVVQGRAVDTKGTRREGDIPLRVVDRGDDLGALLVGQALVQRARAVAPGDAGPRARRGRRRRCGRRRRGTGPPAELQVGGGQLGAARQDHRALDDVLELAHVARPGIRRQRRQRARVDAAHALADGLRVLLDEVLAQHGDVAGPIAQRRQRDRKDVEAVVEILAELAGGDLLLEIPVRRRDHAHVDLDRLGAADALELALLQHAQQLDLHVGRQVADLVEEQRAAVGQLEAAEPPRDRAGERALLVAEQLRLEHAGRERGAVHAHERPRLARAVDVDRARDHLLAGPGLAAQEHRRRRLRHLLDARQDLAQRGRIADDRAEVERAVRVAGQHARVLLQLLGQAPVLAHQLVALDGVGQDPAQLLGVPGLGDVAVDAPEVDRLDQHVDVGEGGHDDADRVGADLARRLEQLEPGHARHALVGDDHRHVVLLDQRQRLLAAARRQQ